MSLVAYGSSDEGSDEEVIDSTTKSPLNKVHNNRSDRHSSKDVLQDVKDDNEENETITTNEDSGNVLLFNKLPKPQTIDNVDDGAIEEDDIIPPKTHGELLCAISSKKDRGPVKISIPALSEFKDVDEETTKRNKAAPSKKGTGLFALLPPPKAEAVKQCNTLIPRVLNKIPEKDVKGQAGTLRKPHSNVTNTKCPQKRESTTNFLGISHYDSNSEEEDDPDTSNIETSNTDFFALSTSATIDAIQDMPVSPPSTVDCNTDTKVSTNPPISYPVAASSDIHYTEKDSDKLLVSNVMNLPKEEILLKNKAEVGPKLPVPEQEYNVDSQGNIAFDEKAIEYLCGKRGVKRKEKEIDEGNIIEINGEDIKPDEREWLVKALTEEPVQRPVSMHSSTYGGSQSKKKHQITYLAQQAKAMEIELKNQWAQNRMTRKQTQSKYGF